MGVADNNKGRIHMKKCLIPGCTNTDDQGVFVGNYCWPCHEFFSMGLHGHSQAERNYKERRDDVVNPTYLDWNIIRWRAIDHYDRMINWAKKQDLDDVPDLSRMQYWLGEGWRWNSCSYCQVIGSHCLRCPLDSSGPSRFVNCCGDLWHEMASSYRWRTWIYWAGLVREYIVMHGLPGKITWSKVDGEVKNDD